MKTDTFEEYVKKWHEREAIKKKLGYVDPPYKYPSYPSVPSYGSGGTLESGCSPYKNNNE